MGVYYKVVCDELRESIDPGDVNNGCVKIGSMSSIGHAIGPLVMATLDDRWCGRSCRLANDAGEDPGYFEYKDVTGEVIADYGRRFPGYEVIRHEGYAAYLERTRSK